MSGMYSKVRSFSLASILSLMIFNTSDAVETVWSTQKCSYSTEPRSGQIYDRVYYMEFNGNLKVGNSYYGRDNPQSAGSACTADPRSFSVFTDLETTELLNQVRNQAKNDTENKVSELEGRFRVLVEESIGKIGPLPLNEKQKQDLAASLTPKLRNLIAEAVNKRMSQLRQDIAQQLQSDPIFIESIVKQIQGKGTNIKK